MREMFVAQVRFEVTTEAQAKKMSDSRIFRAAYDFLLLRSTTNDCPKEVIDFWTKVEQKTNNVSPRFKKNKKYRSKR